MVIFTKSKMGYYALCVCCCACLLAGKARGQATIKQSEITERTNADKAMWRQHLPAQRPRLYFTPQTWRALPARYANAKGREKTYFDDLLTYAATVLQKPVQVYRTPEQLVSPKNALASAQAELWQRPIGDDMVVLSLALALKDNDAMRKRLHEMVISACHYPNWGIQERGIHLATASLARGIAIAYDWHNAMWTDEDKQLIQATIKKHVNDIMTGLLGQAHWAAGYRDNHNQVAMCGVGMCGVAFLNEIPDADEWLGAAEVDFDNVMKYINPDGSTGEGVAYWSYSLAYILQYIECTRNINGSNSLYQSAFLKNCIDYRLNSSTSGFGDILPWGDVSYFGYGPHHILYKLAAEYKDPSGQYIADHIPQKPENEGAAKAWTALWYDPSVPDRAPEQLDYHAKVLDVVTSRSGWDAGDYLLSVKSGISSQSHTHLDIGALVLGFGNEWLLTTSAYGTGKKEGEFFWERGSGGRRWTFLSNATESQSTILINGKNQTAEHDSRGTIDEFVSKGNICWTGVDMTHAYADVTHVRREVLHCRGQYILVFDDVLTPSAADVEWLAQVPPAATADAAHIYAKSKTGASLEVRGVYPSAIFNLRQPTSKYNDVVPGRLKTYSLKTNGAHTRYVVALLPAKAGAKTPVKNIMAKQTANGMTVTVQGEDWTDIVNIADKQATVRRISGGKANTLLTVARH